MKLIFIVCFLGLVAICSSDKPIRLLDFHDKTAEQFNRARSIIASGALGNIIELIRSVVKVFSKEIADKIPPAGPASNMYKMRWSREMEQIAMGVYSSKIQKVEGLSDAEKAHANKTLQAAKPPQGYKKFVWMGPIIDVAKNILSFLPTSFADSLKKFLEVIEIIIIVFWMAICYPKSRIVDRRESYCAAEALFAQRYEVGCYVNLFAGICVVRDDMEPDDTMFKVGAACSACPVGSHCEWTQNEDGYYVEGELCVAPDPKNYTMVAGSLNATTTRKPVVKLSDSMNPTIQVLLLVLFFVFLVKSYSR